MPFGFPLVAVPSSVLVGVFVEPRSTQHSTLYQIQTHCKTDLDSVTSQGSPV